MPARPKLSAACFTVTLLLFLLPFVQVSCAGEEVASISGLKLATGGDFTNDEIASARGGRHLDPDAFALLALLAAALGLVASLVLQRSPIVPAVLGVLGAAFLLILRLRVADQAANDSVGMIEARMQPAFWLSILFFAAAAVLNLFFARSSSPPSSSA